MTTKAPPELLQTPFKKNIIINGVMDIWQRGTSDAIPDSTLSRICDMYAIWYAAGTGRLTWLRSTDVPTVAQCGTFLNYSSELDITTAMATPAAGYESSIGHNIEGYDYTILAGGDATLSFWVKSNKTGIYSTSVRNFGKDRCYVVEYTIDVADTWEKKTIIFPFGDVDGTWDTTNGTGIRLDWCFMSHDGTATTTTFNEWLTTNTPYSANTVNLFDNTANYLRIAGVQLEAGSIATDIERRIIVEELAACQRYYWQGKLDGRGTGYHYGTVGATLHIAGSATYPTTMRAVPVLTTIDGGIPINCTATNLTGFEDGVALRVTITATGQYRIYDGIYSADASLA